MSVPRGCMSAAKRCLITAVAVLPSILMHCEQRPVFATASRIRITAPTPLTALHAGDRFRFRVDVSSVMTATDLEIVEGTRTDVVGTPEHRQLDVVVKVIAADAAEIVTLETFERVFDDSSSCEPWPWPKVRIEGVSIRNHFAANGDFL